MLNSHLENNVLLFTLEYSQVACTSWDDDWWNARSAKFMVSETLTHFQGIKNLLFCRHLHVGRCLRDGMILGLKMRLHRSNPPV